VRCKTSAAHDKRRSRHDDIDEDEEHEEDGALVECIIRVLPGLRGLGRVLAARSAGSREGGGFGGYVPSWGGGGLGSLSNWKQLARHGASHGATKKPTQAPGSR
jgi:hypothetical protein